MRGLALFVTACLVAASTGPAVATDLPMHGGGGGGSFRTACGARGFMAGIKGRTGDWIDAIEAVCVHYDPASESTGAQGPAGYVYGGGGGGPKSSTCPLGMAIRGWEIASLNNGGQVLVQYIRPYCQPVPLKPGTPSVNAGFFGGNGATDGSHTRVFSCPDGELAVGLHGASGAYVDRVGLICQPAPFILGRPTPAPPQPSAQANTRPGLGMQSAATPQSHTTATDTLPQGLAPQRANGAKGVTFNSPMIVAANGQIVMLDYCREWGTACGKPAADAFCRLKGHADASRFQISEDIGHTAIISGGAICSDPTCDGFTKIECNP